MHHLLVPEQRSLRRQFLKRMRGLSLEEQLLNLFANDFVVDCLSLLVCLLRYFYPNLIDFGLLHSPEVSDKR
jgi:hypothetical protein